MKKYSEYKNSGHGWIEDIPAHWNIFQLRHLILSLSNGTTQSQVDGETKFRVSRIETISNGEINMKKTGFIEFNEKNESFKLKVGDILLSHINSFEMVGNCAHYNIKLPLYHGMNLLRVQPKESVHHRYLLWLLKSYIINNSLKSICKHAINQVSIPILSIKHIKVFDLSIQEQTTIANFLDHKTQLIDNLIEKKERLIELLKEERTAIINQAVTKGLDPNVPMKDSGIEWLGEIPEHWGVKRLAYVGEFSKGSGISKSDLTDEGVPVLLYGDIYTQYDIVVNIFVRYTSTNIVECAKEIYQNDLLLTGSGETAVDIGKCVVYTGSERAYAGGDVIILRPYKYNGLFISYVLNSDYLINEKAKLAKGGIIVHIYSSQLRNIFIPIPPINEQNEIVNFLCFKLKTIKDSIENTNNQIDLLEEYKTSLINEAVTGKIKVS